MSTLQGLVLGTVSRDEPIQTDAMHKYFQKLTCKDPLGTDASIAIPVHMAASVSRLLAHLQNSWEGATVTQR